jgi:DNA-binding transcriptional regulator of glucitol operon
MALTTGQSRISTGTRWHLLLRPRWLAWHSFVVVATVGMLLLGDWQLHRAEAGNELSWAYTFEWPLFAAFTVYFWIKSLHDELREQDAATSAESHPGAVEFTAAAAAAGTADTRVAEPAARCATAATDSAAAPMTVGESAAGQIAGATVSEAAGAVETARAAASGQRAASWDATSWDATSWDATNQQAGGHDAAEPVDIGRATPADGDAYLARLMAEVQRPGRGRTRR